MKYLIDKSELIELTYNEDYNKFNIPKVKELLKDKSPVTEVASGEVTQDLPKLDIWFINSKQINNLFKKYKGKNIKIYIQKEGEK